MERVTLSRWMSDVEKEHRLAVDAGVFFSKAQLEIKVARWLNWLEKQEGQRWAVYHSDIYEFLAILLALWTLKRTACVPGDNQQGNVENLQSHVDGFTGEFPTMDCFYHSDDLPVDALSCMESCWPVLDADYSALEIYTSGSSGDPQAIVKTISQLEQEASALSDWQDGDTDAVVIATVSHQHLYGMTFRLFWPLSAGKLFERNFCQYGETVVQLARFYDAFCLISSPALLARMNKALAWDDVAPHCRYVLSSAAALSFQACQSAGRLLNAPVREIYGSSETGAIAWREQAVTDFWQALPGVRLSSSAGSTLQVSSPYLLEDVTLADKVEFDNYQRFQLLGRVDRIVKVEGKRVSLDAIEKCLLKNVYIASAKALVLQRKRTEVAIVVELTAEGRFWLRDSGRKAAVKQFKSELTAYFEAVVLPRRWRFPIQMPFNSQGKLPLNNLRALFSSEPQKWPLLMSEVKTGEADLGMELECFIPADTEYFDGHFASHPILPGVVQVHWAQAFGQHYFAIEGRFVRLEVVKFQQVITPEMTVTLTLTYSPDKQKLNFKFASSKGVHSSGRICFA